MSTPALPPGYSLDSMPPLPTGYALDKPAQPATGAWAGIKRAGSGMVHLPGQVLDAFTKPPQDMREEQAANMLASGTDLQMVRQLSLGIHRLIGKGMEEEAAKAEDYQKQATGSAKVPQPSGVDLSLTGKTPQEKAQHLANIHRLASYVPMVGPMAGDLTERFLGIGGHEGHPDPSGAGAELATYMAAPKIAEEAGGAAISGGAKAAGKVVEAVNNYTPSGNIPLMLRKTATGMLPGAKFFEATRMPTLKEWAEAVKPDTQLSLFKNIPKLGDVPFSEATHPKTAAVMREILDQAPAERTTFTPKTGLGIAEEPPTLSDMSGKNPKVEGLYGKTSGKSNLKANQRRISSPSGSSAPVPNNPILVPKEEMTPEDLKFQDENMAAIIQASIGRRKAAAR